MKEFTKNVALIFFTFAFVLTAWWFPVVMFVLLIAILLGLIVRSVLHHMIAGFKHPEKRPTIHELEKILEGEGGKIKTRSDGSVYVE